MTDTPFYRVVVVLDTVGSSIFSSMSRDELHIVTSRQYEMFVSMVKHELVRNGINLIYYSRSPKSRSRYFRGYLPDYGRDYDIGVEVVLRVSDHDESARYDHESKTAFKNRRKKRDEWKNKTLERDNAGILDTSSNTIRYLDKDGNAIGKGKMVDLEYAQLIVMQLDTFQSKLSELQVVIDAYKEAVQVDVQLNLT